MVENLMTNRKVPGDFWTACVMVRKQGAIGVFFPEYFTVRATRQQVVDFVMEDVRAEGYEPSHIKWYGRIIAEDTV